MQPFLVDTNLSQQGFATSEPFSIEKGGVKPVVFLLAELGYPPYSEVLAVTPRHARASAAMRCAASCAHPPKAGRAISPIPRRATRSSSGTIPQMSDELLAYGHAKMQEYAIVTGERHGDAAACSR